MTKNISEYFMGYEGVRYPENEHAIYKQNKHILRTDILQQHAVP
jgi:hypothetical protein